LAVAVTRIEDRYRISFLSNINEPLILHWGIAQRSPTEWLLPSESMRGSETVVSQERAAQTPFNRQEGLNALHLEFSQQEAPMGIQFVLRQGEDGKRWIKWQGGNFMFLSKRFCPRHPLWRWLNSPAWPMKSSGPKWPVVRGH